MPASPGEGRGTEASLPDGDSVEVPGAISDLFELENDLYMAVTLANRYVHGRITKTV